MNPATKSTELPSLTADLSSMHKVKTFAFQANRFIPNVIIAIASQINNFQLLTARFTQRSKNPHAFFYETSHLTGIFQIGLKSFED